MYVDWKYIYRRRGWTIEAVFNSLTQKTWDAFAEFHSARGIECPPKPMFDELVKKLIDQDKEALKTEKKAKAAPKKKRTYTRKKKGT